MGTGVLAGGRQDGTSRSTKYVCPERRGIIENVTIKYPLFETGQLVTTRGVFDQMQEYPHFAKFINESLQRHMKGDWGDLGKEDKQENELSLKEGYRLFSAYEGRGLPKIWIITEADRSATTVLFPSEY